MFKIFHSSLHSFKVIQNLFFVLRNVSLCFFLLISFDLQMVKAQESTSRAYLSSGKIYTPAGLEGKVEFWKLVFAKYGKDHRVFHNRQYPEVIYSVLDFSEYEAKLSGKPLMDAKLREVDREKDRIKTALRHLASGNKPRNDFEKRIDQLYSGLKGNKRALMREGADDEKIRYQTGIKERFRDGLVRSGRYLRAIEHIFVEEGLPPELGRLPLVESSFDYTAYSSVGAAGIWQFMPATAKRYMKLTNHLDERRDPIIATRAAAKYLKNSYQNVNDWPLAVTSYNHGLSGVMRGIKQVGAVNLVKVIEGYNAKSFGFASSNFYAEFLAALYVEQNAEKYFPGIVREKSIEFEEILVSRAIKFSDMRKASNASVDILKELNRGFKPTIFENRVFIPAGTFVKVPYGRGARFVSQVPGSKIVTKSSKFKAHLYKAPVNFDRVEASSTISSEVEAVDTSSTSASSLPPALELGRELAPPRGASRPSSASASSGANSRSSSTSLSSNTSSNVSSATSSHTVAKGETLSAISRKYGRSVQEIMSINGFKSAKDLKAGARIKIPGGRVSSSSSSATTSRAATQSKTYRVKAGDTLSKIARNNKTTVSKLMNVNGFRSPNDLKAGAEIKIP